MQILQELSWDPEAYYRRMWRTPLGKWRNQIQKHFPKWRRARFEDRGQPDNTNCREYWKSQRSSISMSSIWWATRISGRMQHNNKQQQHSAAHMRQRIWSANNLVQIMSCCLFGAKPLSKPMLGYCQLGPWEPFGSLDRGALPIKYLIVWLKMVIMPCSTSITRFASDVGYRMAKNLIRLYKEILFMVLPYFDPRKPFHVISRLL